MQFEHTIGNSFSASFVGKSAAKPLADFVALREQVAIPAWVKIFFAESQPRSI
jgi:hypothetical protein